MNRTELAALVEKGEIDTVVVAFSDLYGRTMGKRFDARFFLGEAMTQGTHGCDYLLTTDMEMQPVEGYRYANWELGYGDFHLVPDLATLRRATWAEGTAVVLCDVADEATHTPVTVAPRSILRNQIEAARALALEVRAASELEFYLFSNSYRQANDNGYHRLQPAGWHSEDYDLLQGARIEPYVGAVRRALAGADIPVETSKGETGVGQHEVNIRYAEVLEMADRHTLMKQAMKELADSQGVSVTFMAKPHGDQAGSSCHLHLSLWDLERGVNAFTDSDSDSAAPGDTFRWFLGGWMAHVQELMVFYAPTVNAYKRYQAGSWAPTRIAWSTDNRTAGFRVVGSGPSLRIECRIPGADVNPYLVYAAALAAGLDGVRNRIEPPAAIDGDIYSATDEVPGVAADLAEAVAAFAGSELARTAFGADVVEHYTHFYRSEAEAYRGAVTDWERARYFERI